MSALGFFGKLQIAPQFVVTLDGRTIYDGSDRRAALQWARVSAMNATYGDTVLLITRGGPLLTLRHERDGTVSEKEW